MTVYLPFLLTYSLNIEDAYNCISIRIDDTKITSTKISGLTRPTGYIRVSNN